MKAEPVSFIHFLSEVTWRALGLWRAAPFLFTQVFNEVSFIFFFSGLILLSLLTIKTLSNSIKNPLLLFYGCLFFIILNLPPIIKSLSSIAYILAVYYYAIDLSIIAMGLLVIFLWKAENVRFRKIKIFLLATPLLFLIAALINRVIIFPYWAVFLKTFF